MKAIVTLVLLALVTIVGSALAQPTNFDIGGVKLGMTEPAVRAALKKFNPAFKYEDAEWQPRPGVPSTRASVTGFIGVGPASHAPKGQIDDGITVFFTQATGQAYSIVREFRAPDPAAAMLYETVRQSILDKYGKPTEVLVDQKQQLNAHWDYDMAGAPSTDCRVSGSLIGPAITQVPGKCSLGFSAYVSGGEGKRFGTATLVLASFSILRDSIRKERAATEAAEKARDDSVKGAKPKL
jgi:hypothetical protein